MVGLSVVVIGRNEGERLLRCLKSVRAIHFAGPMEVIYVDSGSKDGSLETARDLGAKGILLTGGRMSAARSRNAGWKASSHPFVLFLDGDTTVDPDFVEHAMREMNDPTVAVVFGDRRESHPERSFYNRVLDLDWNPSYGEVSFCGGDALMRRSALAAVNGYEGGLIAGEEPEMCCRMRSRGLRILHIERPMTKHDLAMFHWNQYWRRAVRTGYAYASVSASLRSSATPLWERESQKNVSRALALVMVALAGLAGALMTKTLIPLAIAGALFICLILRTMHRYRTKSEHRCTRLLYAIHSHIQQVPILVGQIVFWLESTHSRGLIEYK